MRRKILGEKHQDTVKSMADLAITYLGLAFGRQDWATLKFEFNYRFKGFLYYCGKAEIIGKQVVRFRRKILEPTHPDKIASFKILTDVYCGQGRYKKAKISARKLLKLQWKYYGEKHPNTLEAMEDLAFVFYTEGRCKRALRIREKVLKLQKETAGEKAIVTRVAMYNLAMSWDQCGRYHDAFSLMHRCHELQKEDDSLHRLSFGCFWRIRNWTAENSERYRLRYDEKGELFESDTQGATHYKRDDKIAGTAIV